MIEKPSYSVVNINDVKTVRRAGPWDTKSGGKLNVLFGLPLNVLQAGYLSYEPSELANIPYDVRGLRSYIVSDLPKGSLGANEWHRIRHELVFVISGSVLWTCTDVFGLQKSFILDEKNGVSVPPFVLHTYQAQSNDCTLLVIANTLFVADDTKTHDTYSAKQFKDLQEMYTNSPQII